MIEVNTVTDPRDDSDIEALCDSCETSGESCPGYEKHCAQGEHCTFTDASCAIDIRNNDHPPTCESCGELL